ncbi:DNA cytosine methyltransferase [Rhizobium sp. BG4]|uniref:DNA cytosine methyltransferase n=1 Tax=Rhizobium sp. BG4 TaxID=2613770 RepID=UPI00193D1751|nr:DNA cytosine methyltransferase [Rhizobium sp. BG4]QRM44610.1 hypothetical protein F2982_14855 [Rhizobium sp. BG4]
MAKQDQVVTLAAEELGGIMRQVAALHLQAAELLGNIRGIARAEHGKRKKGTAVSSLTDTELESVLSERIDVEDVRALMFLATATENVREDFREKMISLETVKLIAAAAPKVRAEALHVLARNRRLYPSDVKEIAKRIDLDPTSEWQQSERSRLTHLETLKDERLFSVKRGVDRLGVAFARFHDKFMRDDEGLVTLIETKTEAYKRAYNEVIARARSVLPEIEALFCQPTGTEATTPEVRKLGFAIAAVQRLARGGFAHNAGRGVVHSSEVVALGHALAYIGNAGAPPNEKRRAKHLKVLELCAGAGGMSIGLIGAGYEHAALFERNQDKVDTLRRNWPTWGVEKTDIRKISDARLRQYAGIDLLAAGLPCGPVNRPRGIPTCSSGCLTSSKS